MAFSNLFTKLSAVKEDVDTRRTEAEDGKRGNGRKRKNQAKQTGPDHKRLCHQAQTSWSFNATSHQDDNSKARHYHVQNTERKQASGGKHNNYKAGHNMNKTFTQTHNKHNVNKWQNKKMEGQKNQQHQQKDTWRRSESRQSTGRKAGQHNNKNNKQDVPVRQRLMTQEFKDQNAILVDGRFLCRHFMFGRCIKEETCQLEHVKGYNGVIKIVCKFYVQGFCNNGESCPFIHDILRLNSNNLHGSVTFPCKFFHKYGECFQGANCRFSHEPLNDETTQLLDEAIKRDDALKKKAEEASAEQPVNTDEPEISEVDKTSDAPLQPLRPSFYNSTGTDAEKETSLCQTEDVVDVMEEVTDAGQPHISPSSDVKHEEPVCYSVEAVLGPQLFKPFPSFYTPPGSQTSGVTDSANQSQVPYSVDAVLRSYKSVEKPPGDHTPSLPPAQTVSYIPKSEFKQIKDPLLSPETQVEKDLSAEKNRNEVNKSQEKMFKSPSSLQVHPSLFSNKCPDLTAASRDFKKQSGSVPESLEPAQTAAHEVKLQLRHLPVTPVTKSLSSRTGSIHLPVDSKGSARCKSEGVFPFGDNKQQRFSRPPCQTSTSKRPSQLRPHLSVVTSDSQASTKPFFPSPGFKEPKAGAAVEPITSSIKTSDSANTVSHHSSVKQPTEMHLQSEKTQSSLTRGPRQHHSSEITAEGSSKTTHGGELSVGCKTTVKSSFQTLFASSITDTLQPIDDSVTSSSCPQGFIQSSCVAPQPADCKSNGVEPSQPSTRSLRSLFAAPPSAALLPCMQSHPDYSRTPSCPQQSNQSANTSHSSPLPRKVGTVKETSCAPSSPDISPNPKIENESCSPDHINQPEHPACSFLSDSHSEMSTSPTPRGHTLSTTHQQPPTIPAHKGSAAAASADSVLKTLFLCLSPYQQEEEQQDDVQISGLSDPTLPEETVPHSAEQQPRLQTPQISSETTGETNPIGPGVTQPQVRNSSAGNMACKPAEPPLQPHGQKHTSEGVSGNVGATPLKDLFKTFDNTVFHFGH